MKENIYLIIPAYNEEESIGNVLQDLPMEIIKEVFVVDNASTDKTAEVARLKGATVLYQGLRGYGNACLKGLEEVAKKMEKERADIVAFIDGDYSDFPEEITKVVEPIINNNADLVIGSRALGQRESGAMKPQQLFGNWLATRLIKLIYGVKFSDLGPFRAIRYDKLLKIGMRDQTFGWTVEMQVKAAKMKLRCVEVPVNYRKRIGVSKITGTIKGTILAGYKIIWTIFRYM